MWQQAGSDQHLFRVHVRDYVLCSSAAASTFCGLDYLSYAGAFCALAALAALALVVRHAQGRVPCRVWLLRAL